VSSPALLIVNYYNIFTGTRHMCLLNVNQLVYNIIYLRCNWIQTFTKRVNECYLVMFCRALYLYSNDRESKIHN